MMAARDQRHTALIDVYIYFNHAHAFFVGHRLELADVTDAIVTIGFKICDAMFLI